MIDGLTNCIAASFLLVLPSQSVQSFLRNEP
jgi:hypothetical protein